MINWYKLQHFYFNKYFVSPLSSKRYYLAYNYQYKFLWFRVAKVASRTMHNYFTKHSEKSQYIYSSEVGYLPSMFKDYFKFAMVRNPIDRFISAWRNKVLDNNMFKFDDRQLLEMRKIEAFVDWTAELDLKRCDEHLRLQSELIDLNNVDFIGKIESFNKDFAYILNQIGMPMLNFEVKNKSEKQTELNISPEVKNSIRDLYEADFKAFYA